MGKLRGELEDLAFRWGDPITWEQLHEAVEARRSEGEQFLAGVDGLLSERLNENGIKARVEWRIKRLYSIHQKLIRSQTSIDQVYDLLALRVITSSVQDCYAVFGIIHSIWRPVPGRIKDFIAMPRPNLYQSLHTTVMGEGGHQFEVQIRTEEMHRIAEEGIAAHWKYKSGGSPVSARDEQRLAWVRQLVEWQRDMTDPNEFLSTLKIDLFPEEVYTFTPKGKVVVVPRTARPSISPTPSTPRSETPASARASTAAWCLCEQNCATATSSKSLPRTATPPAATGSPSSRAPRPQQDSPLAQRAPARARHRDRPQAAGA